MNSLLNIFWYADRSWNGYCILIQDKSKRQFSGYNVPFYLVINLQSLRGLLSIHLQSKVIKAPASAKSSQPTLQELKLKRGEGVRTLLQSVPGTSPCWWLTANYSGL